ncbi:hypothetical protein IPH25_01950 [bacterium]|nr:MAG: hypothetical protein IPG37_04080 [bacterium]QQR62189.1 MAG: hypothetical protein IPH25_01950 [bacterium]QQR63253.1 MAG: hypothetical protein IPH67_02150 [bacterium]
MKRCLLLSSLLSVTTTMFGSELSRAMCMEDAYKIWNERKEKESDDDIIKFFKIQLDMLVDSFILPQNLVDIKYKDAFKNAGVEHLELLHALGDLDVKDSRALYQNTFKRVQYLMQEIKDSMQNYKSMDKRSFSFEGLVQLQFVVEKLKREAKSIKSTSSVDDEFEEKLSKSISNLKNKVEDLYRNNGVTFSCSSFLFKSYTTKIAGLCSVCGVAGYAIMKLYRKYSRQKTHAKQTKIKAMVEPETAFVVG